MTDTNDDQRFEVTDDGKLVKSNEVSADFEEDLTFDG